MASTSRVVMDKSSHQPSPTLNCPRCHSSNTKFCYYNNYSLSQPRHFCKACKRYWTRGGTLRNVPVGGGCRKNKRLKPSSSVNATPTSTPTSQNPRLHNSFNSTNIIISSSSSSSASNHINSPMFSGLDSIGGGLGFSSSALLSSQFHDLHQQPFNSNHFHHSAISFDRNSHFFGNFDPNFMTPMKEIKMEGLSRLCQNQTEQIDLSNYSDPSSTYWNSGTTMTGNWHDPTNNNNNGSSIASLF